eukprot:SAG11_NODE_3144_length_2653_cov_6.857478_2_plen_360_part_00
MGFSGLGPEPYGCVAMAISRLPSKRNVSGPARNVSLLARCVVCRSHTHVLPVCTRVLHADLFRNLGLGNQISLPAGSAQLGAISFVTATYLLLVLQEGVEWRRFIKEPGPWEGIWVLSDAFVTLVQGATIRARWYSSLPRAMLSASLFLTAAAFTGPLFMPIVGVLLDSVDCVDRDDGSGSAGASSVWTLESSPDIKCGSPFHLVLAVPCMLMLAVYTVLALRIQRVRGNLASIEFEWKKPWVLRNDMLVRQWVRHPLQPVDDESKDPTDAQLIDTVSAANAALARACGRPLRMVTLSPCNSCVGGCPETAQHDRCKVAEFTPGAHCISCDRHRSLSGRGADLRLWQRSMEQAVPRQDD